LFDIFENVGPNISKMLTFFVKMFVRHFFGNVDNIFSVNHRHSSSKSGRKEESKIKMSFEEMEVSTPICLSFLFVWSASLHLHKILVFDRFHVAFDRIKLAPVEATQSRTTN
jgi:flagellar biosynthesis protein FlhB